jgi:hypothetical protein
MACLLFFSLKDANEPAVYVVTIAHIFHMQKVKSYLADDKKTPWLLPRGGSCALHRRGWRCGVVAIKVRVVANG